MESVVGLITKYPSTILQDTDVFSTCFRGAHLLVVSPEQRVRGPKPRACVLLFWVRFVGHRERLLKWEDGFLGGPPFLGLSYFRSLFFCCWFFLGILDSLLGGLAANPSLVPSTPDVIPLLRAMVCRCATCKSYSALVLQRSCVF